jgi:hypothetical protein
LNMLVIAMLWLASAGAWPGRVGGAFGAYLSRVPIPAEVALIARLSQTARTWARCPFRRAIQMSDWMTVSGEIMSVALVEHTGPWTADDVEAIVDAGDPARFEVYEGGVLVVSPAPGVGHQRASYWLHRALAHAAIAAGADVEVLEAVNVTLPGGKLLVPDVVVVAAEAVDEMTTRLPCAAVLAWLRWSPRPRCRWTGRSSRSCTPKQE